MRICASPGWRLAAGGWRVRTIQRRAGGVGHAAARLAIAAALVLCCDAAASSQDLPRLPGPIRMTRTGDSPGQVVFKHETHVDASKPACTACHPREFRILKASGHRAPITHDGMDKGHYCGTCHDGKKTFARDDCAACHEG